MAANYPLIYPLIYSLIYSLINTPSPLKAMHINING